MCVSHPFGVSEVEEGEMNLAERTLTLDSVSLGRVSSAKCDSMPRLSIEFTCLFSLFHRSSRSPALTRCIATIKNDRPPQVTHVRRVYRWSAEGDRLTYTLAMSTSKTPELTPRIEDELVKQA
jgi:hypothetical protein